MRVSDELPSIIEVSYTHPSEKAEFNEYRLAKWIMRLGQQKEKEESVACVHF